MRMMMVMINKYTWVLWIWDAVLYVATCYKLVGPGFESCLGTALGSSQPPVQQVLRLFAGVGHDVDCSPLASVKVKNEWSYTSMPCTVLLCVERDTFTFLPFLVLQGVYFGCIQTKLGYHRA
jgi:hypothetical protein